MPRIKPTSNYSKTKVDNLLDCLEEVLPIGSDEWDQVVALHNSDFTRTLETLFPFKESFLLYLEKRCQLEKAKEMKQQQEEKAEEMKQQQEEMKRPQEEKVQERAEKEEREQKRREEVQRNREEKEAKEEKERKRREEKEDKMFAAIMSMGQTIALALAGKSLVAPEIARHS